MIDIKQISFRSFLLSTAAATLIGCGGATDTAPTNTQNAPPPVDDSDDAIVYSGPLAADDDVTAFRVHVWEYLTQDDRCGQCHSVEGGIEPMHMRRDDINLAYQAIQPYIDLTTPQNSGLVQQVAGGHYDWTPNAPGLIQIMIENWAQESGAVATDLQLDPPESTQDVGSTIAFTDTAESIYETTIYPLVTNMATADCVQCHSESGTGQRPLFASNNVSTAFAEARSLIELDVARIENSRLIERVAEAHKIWRDPSSGELSTSYSVDEMTQAVRDFLNGGGVETISIPGGWLTSSAARIPFEGQVVATGGRFDSDAVALYLFREGSGDIAYDFSLETPQLNLTFVSDEVEWLGSWGLRLSDGGRVQALNNNEKLYELIRLTGEYTIESWVAPGNVTQEDARIVTYSEGSEERNFALMQNLYDYEFYSRSSETDADAMPSLGTPSADEIAQATLQHVVTTYHPIDGRVMYVNGVQVASDNRAGDLNNWGAGHALSIGGEVVGGGSWEGTMRLLAIHNRVLTSDQVRTNFDAGVGQKYYLYFDIADVVGQEDAWVVFQVEQYDNTSYLFQEPFFIFVDPEDVSVRAEPASAITLRGMRIGVNGQEPSIGQAFANLDITFDESTYDPETGIRLWGDPSRPYPTARELEEDPTLEANPGPAGTIITLENGVNDDVFFLSFDEVNGVAGVYERAQDDPGVPEDLTAAADQPDIGLRLFDEVFHNMSSLTTVSPQTVITGGDGSTIYDFYVREIRRSLPSAPYASGFLASQQAAVTQLSLAYCTELVGRASFRDAYFPDDYGSIVSETEINNLVNPLMDKMLIGATGMTTDPDVASVRLSLDNAGAVNDGVEPHNPEEFLGLLQIMEAGGRTPQQKATAACTAVLASAVMMMQ